MRAIFPRISSDTPPGHWVNSTADLLVQTFALSRGQVDELPLGVFAQEKTLATLDAGEHAYQAFANTVLFHDEACDVFLGFLRIAGNEAAADAVGQSLRLALSPGTTTVLQRLQS